jgi:hypothetical protein
VPKYEIQVQDADERGLFALRPEDDLASITESQVHVLGKGVICRTDYRAKKRDPLEIVVNATDGFIPRAGIRDAVAECDLWRTHSLLHYELRRT